MQIALLVPGPFETVSGGYNYDRRIVAGLRQLGHTVEVVELAGRHPLPDAEAAASAAASLDALPVETALIVDGLGLPAFAPRLEELVARGAVGLIHHPTALEPGFSPTEHARLKGIEARIFPALKALIATSGLTARQLEAEFAVPPAQITIVEPGTEPAPRAPGSGGETCRLLTVAVLTKRKGHDVLLRALARLTDLDWHQTFVGAARDPDYAEGLKALVAELGLEGRVTFAGEQSDAALEALYQGADVFTLATHWEGYGMAAAEALARGLPVAITAGGAIAEVVPKEAGVIAPPGDHNVLSRAMRRLIADPDLRREMADAAWAAGQRLPRWDDRAAGFVATIEKALAR